MTPRYQPLTPCKGLYEAQCEWLRVMKVNPDICDGLVWWKALLDAKPGLTMAELKNAFEEGHAQGTVKSVWFLDLLRGQYGAMNQDFRVALMQRLDSKHAWHFVRSARHRLAGAEKNVLNKRVHLRLAYKRTEHDKQILERLKP
jgi:hypothetical protein